MQVTCIKANIRNVQSEPVDRQKNRRANDSVKNRGFPHSPVRVQSETWQTCDKSQRFRNGAL